MMALEIVDRAQAVATALREGLNVHPPDEGMSSLPVPPYPVAVWPEPIKSYLVAAAAAVDAPVEMAAVPLAAILGGVIGNRRPLALKPNYIVRPSVWAAVLADPTTGKTPMLGAALALVDGLQADAMESFELKLADFEATASSRAGSGSLPMSRPVLEHYFTNSCTMEWIAPAARDSAGIAAVMDELLGWFRNLDAYRNGKGGDRQAWLSLWSGGPLKVDRKGSGTIFVQHPVVSLCGGIQPGRFPELARDAAADAFLARFLLSAPDTRVPGWSEETISDEIAKAARNLIARLRSSVFHDPLPLSDEARGVFRDWHEGNTAEIEAAAPLMRDVYGKLPAQAAKLACILHACHDPEDLDITLPPERMQGAIDIIEYHRAHALRAYALLGVDISARSDPREARITRILRKPELQGSAGWARRTDILDGLRNVSAAKLSEVLTSMEATGTVERRIIAGPTKSTELWRLTARATAFGGSDYSGYSNTAAKYTEKPETPTGYDASITHQPHAASIHGNSMEPGVVETAERLAMLTVEDLAAYRKELAAAPTDDPHIKIDRQALALFEAIRTSGVMA
jgi:hypothetical protein